MPTHSLIGFIQHIRKTESLRERTDGQLLDAFIRRREEGAMKTLVQRHGPMVWGVCRRVLHNHHDAEDAFQATFLVLVRRASSIVPREMVGNWLYGVAHQTALKARAMAAKRKSKEKQLAVMPEQTLVQSNDWHDLLPLLDEELSRLPDKYRVVIVLCDLEDKTRKQAAHQLGWQEGTVAGRLARARAKLAKRLRSRGVELSVGALAAVASQEAARASVPATAVSATLKAMSLAAAGEGAVTGVISAKVAALTEGMVKAMLLTKLTRALIVLFVMSIVGVGGGVLIYDPVAAQQEPSKNPQTGITSVPQNEGKTNGSSSNVIHAARWQEWATLRNHHNLVYGVAFAAKARLFATAGADGTVRLWDSGTLQEKSVLAGHRGGALAVCFSPDSKTVASGGFDNTVRFWDAATGKERSVITVGQPVVSLAYSPDGKTVATGGGFGRVSRWNVATGMKMEPLRDSERSFSGAGVGLLAVSVAFSPDGKLLAAGMYDQRIRLWELPSGRELAALKGHTAPVFCVAFSPDGKTLVSGDGGSIKVWDTVARKEEDNLSGGAGWVQAVTFAPDGKTVAAGAYRNSIKKNQVELWSLASKKRSVVPGAFAEGIGSVAFSADGGILAAACGNVYAGWKQDENRGKIVLWHLVNTGRR